MARANTNQPPSDLDWENLRTIDNEKKTRILYLYLYENMNMNEVAQEVYGKGEMSETNNVSNVMRCYGFSGRNSGYFSKKLNYKLNYNDFRECVDKYPRGCRGDWPNHFTVDEFMRKKQISKENSNLSESDNNQKDDDRNSSVAQINNKKKQQLNLAMNRKTNTDSGGMENNVDTNLLVFIFGVIFVIAIIRYIISHVPLLSSVFSESGFLGIGALVCILGAIFLLFISIVSKKMRRFLKIIIPMFAVGYLLTAILDGYFIGVIKAAIVAVLGYYFGVWIDKKND